MGYTYIYIYINMGRPVLPVLTVSYHNDTMFASQKFHHLSWAQVATATSRNTALDRRCGTAGGMGGMRCWKLGKTMEKPWLSCRSL